MRRPPDRGRESLRAILIEYAARRDFDLLAGSDYHSWQVALSDTWARAANAQRYTLPDFSSLSHGAGFAIDPALRTTWSATRTEHTVSLGSDYAAQSITAGGTLDPK